MAYLTKACKRIAKLRMQALADFKQAARPVSLVAVDSTTFILRFSDGRWAAIVAEMIDYEDCGLTLVADVPAHMLYGADLISKQERDAEESARILARERKRDGELAKARAVSRRIWSAARKKKSATPRKTVHVP